MTLKGGVKYAKICSGRCTDGRVVTSQKSLGRVVDEGKGIYHNREYGFFTYDLETGTYTKVTDPDIPPIRRRNRKEKLILDFGDAWFIDSFIGDMGLWDSIGKLSYGTLQYIEGFPDEMLDAGRIDGLNEWGLFWKMVFTNSTPAIATSAILSFRGQWDNLLWPLLLAQKQTMKTIPAYLVKFTEEKFADEGAMMAVAVVASIPIIILFLSLSKYFFGGSVIYSSSKE